MLTAKAEEFAEKLDITNFKASVGWLENFKSRQGISFKRVCGEEKSVDTQSTDTVLWNEKLPNILQAYTPDNIYNADETGIFYKMLPDKTMEFKDVNCHVGKKNKERITAMVCANMSGTDKVPLLVIGRASNPRCFKHVKSLSVEYYSNKKAWMTSEIFTEWVKKLEKKMLRKKRKIALIVDKCPAHPKIAGLKAVELVFLPPNTTSKTQPMDQGIIQNLKVHYRKRVLLKFIKAIDRGGQKFTKLDLRQAYSQVELESDSEEYLTINTHLGLFRYRRLAYGVSSVSAIFQAIMDKILSGLPQVVCRIDDILITAPDDETHFKTVKEVFYHLRQYNMTLRQDKCIFMADQVVYMGFMVDKHGIHPTDEKIAAIRDAPRPTNVKELKEQL
ncbi:tigger transposable element-derived protein 4-like [Crassostrea angulata]|uniref:tigger transposable element-derived protein 4-like n=1 Tax=Magallana angulata TaxID=2784310 RepID=UPI0022B1DB22|nr:tigger transposable element-derived protein 4-like [Crassostrea angulata]